MRYTVHYTKRFLAGTTLEGLTYDDTLSAPDLAHAKRYAASLDGMVCRKPCGGSAYEVVKGSVEILPAS